MPKPFFPHPPPYANFGNSNRGQFSGPGQGSYPGSNPNVWINPWFKGYNNSPPNNFIRQNGYDYQKGHNSQWTDPGDQYQGNYQQYNATRNDYPVRNNFFQNQNKTRSEYPTSLVLRSWRFVRPLRGSLFICPVLWYFGIHITIWLMDLYSGHI